MPVAIDDGLKSYFSIKFKGIKLNSIQAVLNLAEEGGTVPFIARYRKEQTNNLDEVEIRSILDEHEEWQTLVKRKEFVLTEIAKQGNLTDAIEKQIKATIELAEVEEIYRPFKRKKKTKATLAREAGLEPLADWIWAVGHGEDTAGLSLEVKAKEFANAPAGFVTYEEVLRGAQHIIVEKLSSDVDLRKKVKDEYHENGVVKCEAGPKFSDKSKYEMYKEFSEKVKTIQSAKASHRYLALRRGWQEGELKVSITANDDQLLKAFEVEACNVEDTIATPFLRLCAKTSLNVHVIPSVVNELHRVIKDLADVHAIQVFSDNVKKVMMSSPFGAKVVLGVDPGIRTGCKIALVDSSGQFISDTVLHTHGDKAKDNARKLFSEVTKQIKIQAIAVGNGTAGRETEKFIRDILKEMALDIPVVLVNESGASIYSASDIARVEFPDLDLTVRGAISIARRLQDPLAELVKIEPKSIGVGQYQHDVNQPKLKKSLSHVVEDCVNSVGVNVNTASESLLQYVAGVGPATAKNIVQFRQEKGLFRERADLLNVSNLSSKVYEQSAGFLRIVDGKVPLDSTGIHPERYKAVADMAKEVGVTVAQLMGKAGELLDKKKWSALVGEFTFNDIIKELDVPVRDPRDPYKIFKFRDDIHEVSDLQGDMICPGIVTNVTNFGAFVDIGVHQDGLVHISALTHDFVDDPKKVVSPGDQVQVKVIKVDIEKKQISLSMLLNPKPETKVAAVRKKSANPKKSPDNRTKKAAKGKPKPNREREHQKPKRPAFGNNPFADLASQLKK